MKIQEQQSSNVFSGNINLTVNENMSVIVVCTVQNLFVAFSRENRFLLLFLTHLEGCLPGYLAVAKNCLTVFKTKLKYWPQD